jgi:uncharacterized membrane protein
MQRKQEDIPYIPLNNHFPRDEDGIRRKKTQASCIEQWDKATGVIAPLAFCVVLTLAAISKLDCTFSQKQPFLRAVASAATLTDIICFVVFIIKLFQLINAIRHEEKDKQKIPELSISGIGMGIAAIGALFFAANVDEQLNFLQSTRLSSIKLPPSWVAPLMFLFALSLLSIAALIAPKTPKKEKNKGCVCGLNWKPFLAFLAQVPGIHMLFYEEFKNVHTAKIHYASSALLFFAALGALYLCADAACQLKAAAQTSSVKDSIPMKQSTTQSTHKNIDDMQDPLPSPPSPSEHYLS